MPDRNDGALRRGLAQPLGGALVAGAIAGVVVGMLAAAAAGLFDDGGARQATELLDRVSRAVETYRTRLEKRS